MTRLMWWNYYVFQWTTVRVCKKVENGKTVNWGLIFFIVPLTGWDTPYRYLFLSKPRFIFFKKD